MSATAMICVLWLAFAVTHMGMSSLGLRPRIVDKVGERGFVGLYSIVALAIFIPLVSVYWNNKHSGPILWSLGGSPPLMAVQYALMVLAILLLVAGIVAGSPAAMTMGDPKAEPAEPSAPGGVHLIARHALFMALALFGFSHMLVNGFASDVAFFGGFVVFSVVGSIDQDRRKLVTLGESYKVFVEGTPFWPLTGRHSLRALREISPVVLIVGLLIAVALRYFHLQLFG
jgi:uncharacterized membrane protein